MKVIVGPLDLGPAVMFYQELNLGFWGRFCRIQVDS